MVVPGADFRDVTPLFGQKIGKDQKKGHCRQSSGFLAQKYENSKTKQKVFAAKLVGFQFK